MHDLVHTSTALQKSTFVLLHRGTEKDNNSVLQILREIRKISEARNPDSRGENGHVTT